MDYLDAGNAIAVDPDCDVYVGGITGSDDFPTVNALQNIFSGNISAFVTKFCADGSLPSSGPRTAGMGSPFST